MWKFTAAALGKDAVLDAAMPKKHGEFLVYGKCFAPQGKAVSAAKVTVKVAGREKTLAVTGHRRWRKLGAVQSISEPEPFTEMEVNYANAFGGTDFAKNPLGKGMPLADEGQPRNLPNIEAPSNPVVFADDRPEPAGFAALDFTWPQRFSKAGTYDEKWLKTRFPGYAADMDWTIFNTAPADQWLDKYFVGNEGFEVSGMHPTKQSLKSTLPDCTARCFITFKQDPASKLCDVPMRAETLLLFPNAERAVVMYRGVVEIETDDASDIAQLLVAAENGGSPKPLSHYDEIFKLRMDKKNGAIHSLLDDPLLPDMPASDQAADAVEPDVDRQILLSTPKGLLRKNMMKGAQKQLDAAKQKILKLRDELIANNAQYGLPPPDLTEIEAALAVTIPPEAPPPKLEELPAYKQEMEKLAEETRLKTAEVKQEAEDRARALCKEAKVDYDDLKKKALHDAAGPPKPMANTVMTQLKEAQQQLKAQGRVDPVIEKQLSDPDFRARLTAADATVLKMYKDNAHLFPAVPSLEGIEAVTLKNTLLADFAKGEKFIGRDFTGADFSSLDLAGIDFSDALLDGVNFQNTNLSNSKLNGAVLTRGNFIGAKLAGASCVGANLGFATLSGVNAVAADFSKAILAGADLSACNFSKAILTGADLLGARMVCADFSFVQAAETKFIQVDLKATEFDSALMDGPANLPMESVRFVGANLTKALFFACQMDDADFTGATLDQAVFLTAIGERVNFSSASLINTRVVKDSRLPRANFTEANLETSNWRSTDLSYSVFVSAKLKNADLSECRLPSCDFKNTQAVNLQLVKADISGADFSGSNLLQANLQKANICGTLFVDASLYQADLLGVKRNSQTVFQRTNLKKTLLQGALDL
jgi:uncharacterized protein YjbI with pentapeptide repeats